MRTCQRPLAVPFHQFGDACHGLVPRSASRWGDLVLMSAPLTYSDMDVMRPIEGCEGNATARDQLALVSESRLQIRSTSD